MSSCRQLWRWAFLNLFCVELKRKITCLNSFVRHCSALKILFYTFHSTVVFVIYLYFYVRFLRDRFITTVNVLGDAMGTGIVEHLSRDDLRSTGDDDASVLKPLRMSENEVELQHFSNVWEKDKFSVGKNACSRYIFSHACVFNSCYTSGHLNMSYIVDI